MAQKNSSLKKQLLSLSVGVRQGYIITKINQTPINSVDELVEILNTNKNNGVLMEGMYENGRREFYGFGLK